MKIEPAIQSSERQTGNLHAVAATHPGTRRGENQDAWLNRPDLGLWAVADGAGGHSLGGMAADAVVAALDAIPAGLTAAEILAQVRLRLVAVHRRLCAECVAADGAVIASTVVVLIVRDAHFACLWAGDSRIYCLHGGQIEQLTSDHSLVQELLDQGAIDPAAAEGHANANVITRAIGAGGDEPELDKRVGRFSAGDRFLLCSDGISKAVPVAELAALLRQDADARAVVTAALGHNANDNATAVTIDIISD